MLAADMLVTVLGFTLPLVRVPVALRSPCSAAAPLGGSAAPQMVLQASEQLRPAVTEEEKQDATATTNDTWYALAYSEQLQPDELFATRLWGEPLVLYRDRQGEAVCVRDACPHRSAPLSMGDVQDGQLRCFYHGWAFGAEGACTNVPTVGVGRKAPSGSDCSSRAVVERDGVLWVWSGQVLTADATKLPRQPASENTVCVDTTLDYGCEWTLVMEKHLESPHLSSLSEPGRDGEARLEAPNVVHHSQRGFAEELHVVPIAPQRTRVMLRQRFPQGAVLAALMQLPGAKSVFTLLVRSRNYQVAREDYSAMHGRDAHAAVGQQYFGRWDGSERSEYGPQIDDADEGTYGLKRSYVQNNPAVVYAPLQN